MSDLFIKLANNSDILMADINDLMFKNAFQAFIVGNYAQKQLKAKPRFKAPGRYNAGNTYKNIVSLKKSKLFFLRLDRTKYFIREYIAKR